MLRVGHIRYLNSLPVYYGIEGGLGDLAVDVTSDSPTELNDLLLAGELDISPISSIEYCRHADELLLLPDICISSDGDVKSILLASKAPGIQDIARVALTSSSATSHLLTKIILERAHGLRPEYDIMPPRLEEMLAEHDAALLIGDDALELFASRQRPFIDLGREWSEYTGLPMVYAVWVVRRQAAREKASEVAAMAELYGRSVDYCYTHRREVADRAAMESGISADFLYEYFGDLNFSLNSRYLRGLKRFYEEAAGLGGVESVAEPEFFPV